MINSMEDLQERVRSGYVGWQDDGDVRAVYRDNLVLFDYTQAAQFKGRWNWFEANSRGLILNSDTGEVVARPFPKFWNWGERTTNASLVEATEKMDGSLGILYRHGDNYRISTRGSFTSQQAEWATKHLAQSYNLSGLAENLTLLFEIIYPENRVVVDYKGFSGLVLLGAIDRHTGVDFLATTLERFASKYGFSMPRFYNFMDIQDILSRAAQLDVNNEGWVLRFNDGQRFKVKGEAYKIAHRLMTGVSFRRVLEAMRVGALDSMIEGVPDEFLGTIHEYQAEINQTIDKMANWTHKMFQAAPKESRKEFAIWIKDNCPGLQGYMFAMLDGKPILDLIYKSAFRDRLAKEPVLEGIEA